MSARPEPEADLADGVQQRGLDVRLAGELAGDPAAPLLQDLTGGEMLAPRLVGIGLAERVDQEGEGMARLVALADEAPALLHQADHEHGRHEAAAAAAAATAPRCRRSSFRAR